MSLSPTSTEVETSLRKRFLARNRARRYREKLRQNTDKEAKISKEQKRDSNRRAQRDRRAREVTWATFPQAFQSLFDHDPAVQTKIKRAPFFEREGRQERTTWITGKPVLIPIGECLSGDLPSSDSLWDQILQSIRAHQNVDVVINKDDGTQEIKQVKWKKVVSILLKEIGRSAESTSELSAVFGLPLPVEGIQLALPDRLGRNIITPDLAKHITAHIGFANQLVNFHIDMGYGGLAALAGECQKIWLLAPPTPENVELLRGENRSLPYLASHMSKLAVIRQTSTDVMFLPPGVIHATFTEKTGILYSNNFRTRENIFGATMGLVHTMLEENDEEHVWPEREGIIQNWILTMRDIKENGDKELQTEALCAFRLDMMYDLRRNGAFRHYIEEIDNLAKECYPKARLRKTEPTTAL